MLGDNLAGLKAVQNGKLLDADFSIIGVGRRCWRVILESRSGTIGSDKVRNPDYSRNLELTLSRLALAGARITELEVVSAAAMKLPKDQRLLSVAVPIELSPETNAFQLRVILTEGQRGVARKSSVRHRSGGNNNKRISLVVETPNWNGRLSDVAVLLVFGILISG